MNVFVVYYDERYEGVGERGNEQRKIEAVYDNVEAARARVQQLNKFKHIVYADFDVHELLIC
jgi:hypothetical protein